MVRVVLLAAVRWILARVVPRSLIVRCDHLGGSEVVTMTMRTKVVAERFVASLARSARLSVPVGAAGAVAS